MSKWKIFGAVALVIALLSFNWDRIELESRAFVVTLGIDVAEADDSRFEVSMNIAHTADRENGGTESVILRRAEGDSLAHAMGQVEAAISEKIYFGHTKAIVLSEAVLEDASLLREVVDTLSRNNEINIKATVVATDKSAAELLAARPRKQGLLGVYLSGFFNSSLGSTNSAASAVKLDLEHLDLDLLISGSVLIPMITLEADEGDESPTDAGGGEGDNDSSQEVIISGIAVVRDYALIDRIEQSHMGGFLWLKEDAAGTRVVLEHENDRGYLTFLTNHSKARMNFSDTDGVLLCRVTINVEGSIQGASYMGSDYSLHFDSRGMAAYEDDFAAKIKEEAEALFEELQGLGVDGLGLKESLRKKDRLLYRRYAVEGDWQAAYEGMVLEVEVDVAVRNAGAVK